MLSFENALNSFKIEEIIEVSVVKVCERLGEIASCCFIYQQLWKNLLFLPLFSSRLLTNTVLQRTPAIRPSLEHISNDKDVLFLTISLSKMLSMRSCRAWIIVWAFLRNLRDCWLPKQASKATFIVGYETEIQMNSLVPPEARFLALGSKGVGKSGTSEYCYLLDQLRMLLIKECLNENESNKKEWMIVVLKDIISSQSYEAREKRLACYLLDFGAL